jgi:hypothetical protein
VFFIYLGWLEFGIFAAIYKKLNKNKIDDSSKANMDPANEGIERALQRAEEEENRRREEQQYMRASYSSFSGRMSLASAAKRGSTGAAVRQSQMSYSANIMNNSVSGQSQQFLPIQTNYPGFGQVGGENSKATGTRKSPATTLNTEKDE